MNNIHLLGGLTPTQRSSSGSCLIHVHKSFMGCLTLAPFFQGLSNLNFALELFDLKYYILTCYVQQSMVSIFFLHNPTSNHLIRVYHSGHCKNNENWMICGKNKWCLMAHGMLVVLCIFIDCLSIILFSTLRSHKQWLSWRGVWHH